MSTDCVNSPIVSSIPTIVSNNGNEYPKTLTAVEGSIVPSNSSVRLLLNFFKFGSLINP
jgi:hypothetical protein